MNNSWEAIFKKYQIDTHNFEEQPFFITAEQIKLATHHFSKTAEKEVRILCKQDSRENRPLVFIQNNLFLLPVKNGIYAIIKGEGYIDIPPIESNLMIYTSKLDFPLETSLIGNSEMQHLDFAYASSLIRYFTQDDSLVLTIRGRKYSPQFQFAVNKFPITVESVQTEIDAGYEGRQQIVLIEAKNSHSKNTIIRQLYYPYRQWKEHTSKKVSVLFFEKRLSEYFIWQFEFTDLMNYNSINLVKSARFQIQPKS